jgi:hypothetical protein
MKFKRLNTILFIALMIGQAIHSIKIARLESNESNHAIHFNRRELWPNASDHPVKNLTYKLFHKNEYKLRSMVREIDLGSITVNFRFPDSALYINEGIWHMTVT